MYVYIYKHEMEACEMDSAGSEKGQTMESYEHDEKPQFVGIC